MEVIGTFGAVLGIVVALGFSLWIPTIAVLAAIHLGWIQPAPGLEWVSADSTLYLVLAAATIDGILIRGRQGTLGVVKAGLGFLVGALAPIVLSQEVAHSQPLPLLFLAGFAVTILQGFGLIAWRAAALLPTSLPTTAVNWFGRTVAFALTVIAFTVPAASIPVVLVLNVLSFLALMALLNVARAAIKGVAREQGIIYGAIKRALQEVFGTEPEETSLAGQTGDSPSAAADDEAIRARAAKQVLQDRKYRREAVAAAGGDTNLAETILQQTVLRIAVDDFDAVRYQQEGERYLKTLIAETASDLRLTPAGTA